MKELKIESHFFPSISYFFWLLQCEQVAIEGAESFQKQSYRNRCHVLGPNGQQALSLPICHGESRALITTTKVDYKQDWVTPFWRTLEAAYRKSPYFDYFEDAFKELLFERRENLFELNQEILRRCMHFLNIKKEIRVTTDFLTVSMNDRWDKRGRIHPKKSNEIIRFQEYPQNFGKEFVGDLSVIDLIMNEGPAGVLVLKGMKG